MTVLDQAAGSAEQAAASAPPRHRRIDFAVVGAVVAFLALTIPTLGAKSFWLDETYTWATVSGSWSSTLHIIATREFNGALYSLVQKPWMAIAGNDPTQMRLLSVLFGVGLIIAIAALGRVLFDRTVGRWAAVLVAVNAAVVSFAQQARGYALVMFLATVTSLLLVKALERPRPALRWAWIITSVLLMYAHSYGALVVFAQAVAVIWYPFGSPDAVRAARRWLIRDFAIVGAIGVVSLGLIVGQHTPSSETWISAVSAWQVARTGFWLTGNGGLPLLAVAGGLCLVGFAALVRHFRARGIDRQTWSYLFVLSWALVPIVVALAGSVLRPTFFYRYLLGSLPAVALLTAYGITRIRARAALVVVLVLLAATSGRALWQWETKDAVENWRGAVEEVADHAQPGDVVVFTIDEARIAFEYYLRDRPNVRRELRAEWPSGKWGSFRTGDQRRRVIPVSTLDRIAADSPRLWVIANRVEPRTIERRLEIVRADDELVRSRSFTGQIHVYEFRRR